MPEPLQYFELLRVAEEVNSKNLPPPKEVLTALIKHCKEQKAALDDLTKLILAFNPTNPQDSTLKELLVALLDEHKLKP